MISVSVVTGDGLRSPVAVCVAVRVVLVMFAWPYLRQPNWMDILSIREGVDDFEKPSSSTWINRPWIYSLLEEAGSSKCV